MRRHRSEEESRRLPGARRRGFDTSSRRSKANPVTRRRDAILTQRQNGARKPRDIAALMAQQLLAAEREIDASELAEEPSQPR